MRTRPPGFHDHLGRYGYWADEPSDTPRNVQGLIVLGVIVLFLLFVGLAVRG